MPEPLPQTDSTDLAEFAERHWDAVVVGTGMGGATIGYALARAGWRVLFCEKGRSTLHGSRALRGDYAERYFTNADPSEAERREVLQRAGREWLTIRDDSAGRSRRFVPFIGSGSGGSTALYGMALERFFPADFEPAAYHPDASSSSLPERWPIGYDELAPYYTAAERLYGVRGSTDPLKRDGEPKVPPAPPLPKRTQQLADQLQAKGLHPYHLPMACEYVADCTGCQGFLCARGCKHDSAGTCLVPAVASHGAVLLDECEVVRLEADAGRVTQVICRRGGVEARLRGRIVILAAGALATPVLMLRSASSAFPRGLANSSGLVGKNLMRHFVDLYAIFPRAPKVVAADVKAVGCNDFYVTPEGKFGALQSFGELPPPSLMLEEITDDARHALGEWAGGVVRAGAPLAKRVLAHVSGATVLASIMEDLPYAHNAVAPCEADASQIAITYRIDAAARSRIRRFRHLVADALRPSRFRLIGQARSNRRLAHACGTCRFGMRPQDSVLDSDNRAHDLANLYVVDASFFPSSGGTNPALTIAANALRVADRLTRSGASEVTG